jgi:N12 class adenine-specific DNA methylase|nr:MAG TPA: Chromatin remodeling complex ATPase [Caudoviricetes sp.]
MEMQDKPLRKLYTSLKSNNYDVPDNYESFERTLTQAGQAGAQSRRALHESLKKDNYDVPDNYDSFYKSLFTPVNSTTSMAIGSEPAKPAPQKPTTSTTTATPQHTVPPTKPAPAQPVRPQQVQKPQGKPMTAAQKAAAIGWAQGLAVQTKANTQRAMQKIKNIGKYQKAQGVYGQTKKGNIEYNPKTGKMEQTYLTPQGEQTTHKATADLASHEFRVQQGFLSRMSDNGLNPDNPEDVAKQRQLDKEHPIRDVLDSVWKEAEGIDKQAQEELRSKASSGFSLSTLAEASNSAGAPLAGHDRNFNDELSYQEKRHKAFDFDKMANTIYSRLPKDYRNDRLREYTAYFSKHPKEAKGKSAVAAAKDALMGQIYNNVYSHAVQERLPKSNLEFLLRKVSDQPLISSKAAAEFAASSRTGSHGLEVAERDAMAQFGGQHKAMNIIGTVANMALDPITYVSGGVGGFVGKKALGVAGKAMLGKAAEKATEKAVGKVATDVASRYAAGTLAGRVVQGVAGGAANFATFNTLKGIEEQVATGGVVNPETGKSEGFSVGEILKSTGHGLLLGAATGTLSPIIGNFADKAVKATTSTVGKVALRVGETAVSTLAEGTVFSIPEWISGQGDAFDVWTDSMAMMLGFKASHAIKSAPRVLDALRTDGKRYGFSFKERLNKQMEASPSDAGFTSEEFYELRNNGYMDLFMLFRNAQKQKYTNPKSHEVSKEVVDDYENLTPDTFDGYEAMKRLMNDKEVSEATRAKAYYILTGRMLPMSTITGYTTDKTEDGDIVVKSMSAQGDVVTSRLFSNEKAAQGEIDKIMRQSELNSVDVGEKYKETASNMLVVETAIKEVAPDADMETVLQNYRKVKSGQEDMPQEIVDQAKAIDVAIERNRDIADANRPEAIRAKLKKETGLDVDTTLRKMPKDRTEEEKELVDTYIKSLFPEQEKTEDGQTADVQADTEYKQRIEERQQAYDEGKEAFNVADTEGDNSDTDAIVLRYREAYDEIERVFADDAEMRIAQLEEDPWEVMNDQSLTPEQQDAVAYFVNSKAAMDGLTEAANENSENKRAEAEHKIAQRTNKQSGMIHPATLKVDDKQVYIVSGNVTMFPDGSTVDIHHSSESVVVCDAETGELKFISPEQIYKVDEPVDPSMELKAVDEAISAEQQAILGNEAETEVSESEEIPEQEENEQPQTVQQDDDVEEMNLDVQNEGEVNLPHNEDLQPSNETIEDDLPQQPETALQRIPKGENGEPLLEQTDPETAWDGVVEYMEDADDAQEYVESMVAQLTKDADNAKKAVSKVKPSADMAKFKADKAAARQIQADAEARLDKWLQISNVNKARKQAELNRINAERAEADRIAREKAVAELAEQKRVEAEKKAEQEAIGAHAVNPKIKEKWDAAPKVVGSADIITLPDGSKLRGHYVLTEAGAATASHDVNNAYKPTEGFPIDENGQSVNDRDYERDEDARKISRSIADNYDSRALQSVTVVDNNGITLSGNGRNIAGELAAKQGTDGAYIDYLREFPQKYGLTAEQVQSMQHPRVHFVPDEVLPYDAATFARFNAQEMKSQSKPEAAVKLGKVVPDNTFGNIVRSLAQYDRLSDFYANEKDANGAIMELVKAGVVNDKQLPELRTGDALSAAGRELLENTLIGKVFQSNPDAVRQIIAQPGIKQSIVMALSEIAHNRTLANGYDLSEELSNAVDLVARAKQADPDTYKEGMPVSPFGRQQGLFDDELGDKRVTDATTLLLADILNSTKPSDLRKVLATYNAEGETAANGQLDIFSGDLRNKEEILTDINKHFINATAKEQQALVDAAIAERKRRAAEAAATEQSGGNDTAEQAASVETSSGQPQPVPVETTPIGITSTPDEVQAQREQTETNPTEAQKEAGNYRKGHIKVDGYDIALENPKGTTRSGKDANGKEWSITMKHDYGYIRGTKGTDGDHIDVYLSDNPTAGNVYVVDQIDQQTGDFDEHKVMYGFNSMEEAVQAYRDQYEDGWKVGTVTEVSREEFKKWVDSSVRKTKPFADYKTVKPLETEHTQSGENYAHNSEEIMHEDVKPAESPEKYTITPTQYTNKKGKTSDMYLVKFNHELSKEEKAAAKTFISEPLAEGKRTPRGWYDREQEGYMVRSEDAAKHLGDMMSDEVAVADEQPLTVQDYRNAVAPAAHKEQEKKPANTVSVEDTAIQDVDTKVYNPKDSGLDFNGDVSKEDFNDALKDLRSLLGVSDDEGDVGILFRDDDALTKEQRKKIKAAGLSVTQVLVDNGMVKFSDYANKMVSLIGDKIRPWLKSFYEGIRWEPGYESVEFTPSDEVARFDVQNFDKPTPDVLKQAEMVVAEQKAAKIAKQTEQEVKTERNEKRKEDEKRTEANTAAITEEAGAVASKARTVAKRATTDTEVRNATEKVDATLEKVNNQLALLGYYEADKVEKDFNEAYGYMRNAEKKAVKDATALAKRIADDLGVDIYEATHTAPGKNGKRKSKPLAVANIAPIGGEITIHLPLEDGKNLSIYIILKANDTKGSLVPGDNLEVGDIMYRLEKPNASGQARYGINNFVSFDVAYNELLDGIRRITDSTEVRDKSNPDIKSYLAEHLNSIAKDKSIQQIINPATGNSEEVIRDYLANGLPGYVIDHFTNYADPKVKTLLEYVTGDKSLSKEENKKNLDLIIDALIDRTRSILKDGEDVEEFHGGEQVYSVKHGAYKHILAAFHGSDGKTEYYTFSDGTKANANEVQKTEPQRDLTEENSQPVIGQPTNNKLLAQYNALKEKHPDTKILLRVGDFYETYQDDAKDLSKTLGIVLTKRNDGVNMVGFPYHALDTYLPKLIRAGYRVAINEHLELPKTNEDVVPNGTPQPKKVNVESLVRELQDKGKARLSEHTEDEKATTQKEKPTKKNNSKKKSVSLKREPTVGDLFGDLFDNNDLDSKDNDTARTRQAESSSRENGTVGSISTERDGVLDTRSTGTADGGEAARVSDTAGTVADGERKELLGQRSSRSTSGGNHGDGEAERPMPERGQRIGDRDDANGRSAIARATDESQRTSRPAAGSSEQLVHGEARRGGRGRDVASTKQLEPKFKRNYLYPENSSEIDNMTPQQRLRSNVEALTVVRTLMKEGREATADERDVLGRYRGWGGVDLGRAYSTDMMRRTSNGRWGTQTENDKLLSRLADIIDELDPDGKRGVLSAINRAALTSYYTPTAVAKTLNDFVEFAGFKGGNMLDPSMGSGIFEGTMSKAVQQSTMIHGIELDWLTGQIARNLYPDANVLVTGYEQAGTADNAYDVVMSNIPFGDLSVTDKTWKHDSSPVRKAAQNRIHNYFAVKMLDNTRPGGLCVIMTSNAILDTKSNQIIREHLADKAEVLGVVRLPDNTFKGAGTSVVTDVILLRKYKNEADRIATRGNETYTTNIEKPFLSSGELQLKNPTDGKTYNVSVNGYFTKNKDMMIGDGKAGGQYRADEFGLSSTMSTDEIAKSIRNLVEKKIVADRKGKLFDTHKTEREVKQAVSEAYKGDGNYISSGNIVEQDGMIGVVTSTKNKYGDVTTTFNEVPSLKGKAERIQAMLPIRKAMKQLIDMQIQGVDNNHLEEARTELQNTYDAFVKKYGRLNDKANDFLTEDIDGYTLRSLEKYKDSKFIGLSDIFTKNTIKPALDMTTAKTPQDAISLSLAEYGEIKPSFMKDVLGENWAEQCDDILFKTPFTEDEYETVDAYLSGDVKTKLEQARAAAKEDATLQRNVDALEAVQPKDIPFEDISIRMGARWIPAEVYTDFMFEQFGIPKYTYKDNKSGVEYLPEVDQYVVNVDKNELGGEADAWRTSRRSASEVFTAALQDKSLSVFDTVKEGGKETKVLNKEETELLNNKIQDLRTAFEDWIGQNPEREEMLMRLYNDKFNRTVLRKFDGSHLNVAGLMGKELRPHQKDAVWMLVNNRGGIVDHIVGAGKTLVMQSAIMEMRRMGIAKKPMIIALKSTVAQIAKEFREAYPAARILAPTEKDFAANNRKKFMAQIALNDYDCVILSHDQYNMLPHTEEVERSVIDEQMAQLDNAIEFLYGQADKSQLTKKQIKGLEKRKNNLETKLTNLLDRKIDREFTFEGLGVDYLFVDECQHFKSLPYVSTYDRVAGLGDKKGSQKSIALLNGVRYLQKMHQGDQGTVFLSGTTISNSLSEIYHLLNYLRPSEMERLGMTTFDAWAGNFAIHTAELEYGVTSELKEKDRFRSLTNIPELAKMYAEIADVRNDLNLKLPKPKMRSHIVTVPQTELMQEINREIVNMVKGKDGSYFNIISNDNTPWGLLASTLSAKAAINPRLIDESWESEGGKIPAVCENVKKIYDQFAEQKGTQLIFCDTGVPGKGKKYDAYSDIINRLVNDYGIPRKEIADIHEANTDEKRKELFAKVNDGSVRILIGGTKNMGTGVNVQKRIVAMHHVDVPWTPADREQREGRGVRQGNEIARDFNDDNVDVYFYATEGSLDMYKYQLQETKGKLFAQFKSGTIGDRTFDEGDAEGDFDPAEVVAMLSGNPVIFEKSKQDKKVEKLRRAKRAYESDWQRRHARYEELQTKKRNYERLLSLNASDVRELERGGFTADAEGKYPSTVTVSVKDDYSSRKTFEKPKEAGAYIHELLKQNKRVQLSGFQQTANISIPITDAGLFGKPVAELESYGGIKYAVEVSDDDTAAGVAFRNLLQKIYSNKKVYERNIEDVNNQLKGADPGENVYPKQAELDEALKEKRRLDEEYKKLSDEEDKPTANDDTRYRDFDEEVNEQFNRELAGLTEENADTKIFNLGSPSSILLSAGVEDKSMKLYGSKLMKKAKLHGFAPKELENLPAAVADPIAVFDNYKKTDNRSILTELKTKDGNFLVSLTIGKGIDVDFNIIASAFGKANDSIVKWINKGFATYINKEKALNYLYLSAPIAEAAENSELSSAAKIVKDFVNPNIGEEKTSLQGKIDPQDTTPQAKALQAKMLSEKLNTPIRVVSDPEEIAELPSRRQQRAKGWWSAKNDEVVILLPNNADVADVANTAVHEVVGHNGLRKLIGVERFDDFLGEVYEHASKPIRAAIDKAERKLFEAEVDKLTQQKNAEADRMESHKGVFSRAEATVEANKKREQMRREATEEYMADMAGRIGYEGFEKMSAEELTFWGKVKAKVQQFLDKFLRGLKIAKSVRLTDKDVAYILYKSWKNLRNGGKPTIMDAAEDALMRSKAHYDETDVNRFRDGDMGLEETITNMKAEISAANKDDFNAKVEAMKAIGGNLQKLRSAMSRQRSYDISTAKAMTDLAQVLLDKGLLDNLSVYETKRVLSAVRNGVGKEDISGHVQKLMDIMVDNQLHSGANILGKLFTMRGTRLNDRGIEVQGNLDPQGQILVKTARKYTSFPKEEIDNTLIPDLMSRMGSDDQTIADNAAIEYAGAQIARRYVEEITESKAEEKALRESIKTAKEDKDAGKLDADAYKQYVNATEEAIRQNKIDRAEAYSSIAAEFGGMLGESAKRAKEWREAEQKRINDIHHNCNSDMEGRITDEHHKDNKVQKLMNNSAIRFLLAPLGTFDQMLRMFGKKNVNGEGYLWNRFMRSWVDATENEYTGYRDDLKELDAKVSEVYGKKMKWADLFSLERKMGKVSVEFWDGGERKLHELTQGNLLYIYMVDKMSDGRMKLRYMGITEQDVQHITEILDPKFKELADWLQEEYLVNKRNKYNEVHKRMFGAPMAAIDNYFPLKILKNALDKEEDVAKDDNAGIVLPGTTTNGIIKRTRNNKPLDVTGADAFNVIADHLQEMEHWAAFAELTRDINTMLSYKRFRNQVMNMSSAYGAGAALWKNFRSVCKMAVGAYRPPIAELDKTAVNVAKGVTAAKVSFRVFTALKQFLSFPAYLPDASLAHLAKDVINPVNAWNWSMKNLPIFEKRWQSRMAGDPRLMKSDMDWKAWRSRIVEIASMIGMSPNAFVDALTVAMGAHAMYQSRYAKYKRWGFDEVTADKRAKQDATILYNSTQQSSEGAFLSPMQVDRSWLSVLFTVFRNSSMSYTRQQYDAFRNEVKLFTPGYRQRAEEFMVKQLQREGLTEEQAKKAAHEELRKGPLYNLARVAVFGFLLQFAWNLGAYLPYLILGDDDDEKKKMTDDALTHALFGSLEGLTGGDVLSQAGNMALQGEGNWATVTKDMPLVSDLSDILKTFPKDNVEALNDCVNLLTQSAVGVNPQSITDAMVAIMDYCGDDAQTSRECALLMARILNCPQSQLDKIYFDELSASGVEASKMTPSQIAERFARYKRHRSAPLTGWMYSDAAIADKDGKRKETVYKKARENFKAAASKSNKEELEQWKAEYKETAAKLSAIKKLREQDEDEADEQMDALENTPEYDRYLIMKDYNSEMNDITKAWLNSKSPTEREQLTKAMFKVQQEMVNELKTSK